MLKSPKQWVMVMEKTSEDISNGNLDGTISVTDGTYMVTKWFFQ